MAIKTKTFTLLGFIFTVACLIFLIIAFASDRWVVSTQKEVSGFENMGLWSACFSAYRPPAWSLVDRYYDGCWWVLDREMDDLRHFLFPSWFVGTQVLVTLGLVFQLIAIIVMIVNAINCFPYSKLRDKIKFGLSVSTAVLHGLTGLFLIVAVIMFGARADNERSWLEKPDQNYLSWSFGMCVLAAFLAIIAFMCQLLESCRLRLERGNSDEPQVYLTNQPPPSTNYAYSRQKFPPSNVYSNKPNTGQPAYVSRYSNQGSQSSLNTKPPDTLFAVSGAGEVYINRLADYDENKQRGRNGHAPPASYEKQTVSAPTYRERQAIDTKNHSDNTDSHRAHTYTSVPRTAEGQNKLNDYEESKQMKHPVLPEYVPKSKDVDTKKQILDSTLDESEDYDVKPAKKQKDAADSGDDSKKRKRTSSESKGKKSKNRSDSKKGNKKKGADTDDDRYSDAGHSRRRSKKRGNKSDTSDDERSRSRRRSKKGQSPSTRRRSSRSRDRSHSRDLNSSYSDSYVDSDSASARGRTRRKRSISEERGKKDTHKHSTSVDRHSKSKKKGDGNYTDDMSGSEYSSKRKSQKKRAGKDESSVERKTKSRDYSDTESTRSKQSRRPGEKPKGTYSSYYEY